MKKYLLIILAFLFSTFCKSQQPEICYFGNENVNNPLRELQSIITPDLRTQQTSLNRVILLDFDGHNVTGWGNPFQVNSSGLTSNEQINVFDIVRQDFSPFDVTVTTSESVYNNANPFSRIRVVVTESWEWFGSAGGVAFVNSFTWGNNTPCFVFSSLLGYSTKNIGEVASHEAGHTLGLYHQSVYNQSCQQTSQYNSGSGSGVFSWAPIMGVGYQRNLTTWHLGPNSGGCANIQNDIQIIEEKLPKLQDQDNIVINGLDTLTSMITDSLDVDDYFINASSASTWRISLIPASNTNLRLKLIVNGEEHVDGLGVIRDVQLPAGQSIIQVTTHPTSNASVFGMIGEYKIKAIQMTPLSLRDDSKIIFVQPDKYGYDAITKGLHTITVHNMSGQLIFSEQRIFQIGINTVNITLTNKPSGIYILTIQDPQTRKTSSKKFMI